MHPIRFIHERGLTSQAVFTTSADLDHEEAQEQFIDALEFLGWGHGDIHSVRGSVLVLTTEVSEFI